MQVQLSRHAPLPLPADFDADDTLVFADPPARRFAKRAAAFGSLAIYAAYLVYRGLYTLNPDAIAFSALVYFAECHGFLSLLFYYHQCTILRRREVPPVPEGLRVDVFITTYNEELDLLRQTIRGALAMRYPHRTFVLDDGRRPQVRALAEALGAGYITREDRAHAKAGNWNNAFRQTDADLIATFDADHVPRPHFLERTLGFFRDPRVAFVQVPQQYHNLDSVQHWVRWQTRRMYSEQNVFFNLVMPGKDHTNSAFFCGTGAVLRRAALEKHGGIVTGTITEDLHTSIVLHSEGWKSVYLNETLVTGLAPMDLRSFEVQRLRWAEGNLRTVSHINPITCRGLTAHQRVNYLASLYHWTIGLPKLVFYLAPPWMLFSHTFPIANFDGTFIAVYLVFLASLIASYKIVGGDNGWLLMDEIFNMASFFTMLRAVKRALFGRGAGTFVVTSKAGGETGIGPVVPHLVLLGFSLLAMSWSWMGLGFGVEEDAVGAGVASFWTLYNMALLYAVLRMAMRPPQRRRSPRFRAHYPVEVAEQGGQVGLTGDISEGGCTLLWPGHVPIGSVVTLTLHMGEAPLVVRGAVRAHHRSRRGGWHAHGVRFVGTGQPEIDRLNDAIFQHAVPALFSDLGEPSIAARLVRRVRARVRHARREGRRLDVTPVRITDTCGSFLATTRDVSAGGLGFYSPRPMASGTAIRAEVFGPRGPRALHATVIRCVPGLPGDPTRRWMVGVRVDRAALLQMQTPGAPPAEAVA